MAYAGALTYAQVNAGFRKSLHVTLAETEGAATSEKEIPIGRYFESGIWRLVRVKLVETSGAAATYAPVFGVATAPTSGTIAYVGGLGAAASQDSTNTGAGWYGYGTSLFWRSVPNTGSDNITTVHLYFVEGWQA